jgi:hypothetical protein
MSSFVPESGVYGTRFAFVFDLLQSSAAEDRHLVLEKLFKLLFANEHRALLSQFILLVLNNEHERELFVNALIQLDTKYDVDNAKQSEQVSPKLIRVLKLTLPRTTTFSTRISPSLPRALLISLFKYCKSLQINSKERLPIKSSI